MSVSSTINGTFLAGASCTLFRQIVKKPLYYCTQVLSFFLSLVAIPILTYFAFFKLKKARFNRNVLLLYRMYFGVILTSVVNSTVAFGHHIVTPWIAKSDCDYLVDTGKLRGMQILGIIGISGPSVFMQGIIFERLIALARAKFYENSMFLVGPIIAFVSCIATGALVVYLFIDETFTEPTFSYVLIPSTSGPKMNYLCWGLLSANLIDLVANLAMEKINTCIRKRSLHTLSTRYQLEENIFATRFSFFLSLIHLAFFSFYYVITLTLRYRGSWFVDDPADLMALRGIFLTIPTYNLLIGFLSIWKLNSLAGKKRQKLNSELALQYTGPEGTKNYEIFYTWTSKIAPIN
ncbi:hypothetical protein L3Y34_016934 [Caenorhabditis briggsae]|uniref:Uncharacterized protein n=1 Tax=Caenorhabditis briggsae TaxID=6238 RepID=A0AAE9ISK0_CAEBR|nr:hypothetical protein L3Y34_016934 [Caenorhabditis briggsae]